jgi:hypothetical protein
MNESSLTVQLTARERQEALGFPSLGVQDGIQVYSPFSSSGYVLAPPKICQSNLPLLLGSHSLWSQISRGVSPRMLVTCLFYCATNNVADDRDSLLLTKSHNSSYCLRLYHWIPLRLKDVNRVCDGEVKTERHVLSMKLS